MQEAILYSAPGENYPDHILSCIEKFDLLFPIFYATIARSLYTSKDKETLKDNFLKMILFHDLGKLTRRWQEKIGSGNRLPSHSTLGAAYLWKLLLAGIKEPLSFAVAIQYTDRGLLRDNIERPDVQAILDGIVKDDGRIDWYDEALKLDNKFFPADARELEINDLKEMARGLRIWARGCGLLEQHQRRLQASLAHHIHKLCDISAATKRKEYQKDSNTDYYGGWLMVENINNYVENMMGRYGLAQENRL